jgi:Zn-dependent peptidase ImmA (M78 family)
MTSFTPAERALRELGISKPEEIDLDVVARHLGAKVKYRRLESCEARIIGRENRAIITVDERMPAERRRFSVGHELGHWHYHRGRCLVCRYEDIGNNRLAVTNPERVADSYAADLLMPRYLFDPMLRGYKKLSVGGIRQIKNTFNVSMTAAALRILETNRYPFLLVCHGQGGRRWFRRASCVPDRWFPRDDLDKDSFAFDMLFGHGAEQSHPRKIGADAWFDRREAERYEIFEHSYALPNKEVATLLLIEDGEMLEE